MLASETFDIASLAIYVYLVPQLIPRRWGELVVTGLDKASVRERRRAAVEARRQKEIQVRFSSDCRTRFRGYLSIMVAWASDDSCPCHALQLHEQAKTQRVDIERTTLRAQV